MRMTPPGPIPPSVAGGNAPAVPGLRDGMPSSSGFGRRLGIRLGRAVWAAPVGSGTLAFTLAGVAFGVYLLQAMIGAANVWTELADEVAAAHLATATVLWLVLALLNIRVWRLHERLPRTVSQASRSGLAGVTR